MKNDESLTIKGLASEVERLLESYKLLQDQKDGRVSSAPDVRTIRYYTTLGLLKKPEIVGRQARYNQLHVLQITVIKLFQHYGLSLASIQARLYGKNAEELEHILLVASKELATTVDIKPIVWQEVTIQPGLKLMVEKNWNGQGEMKDITAKIELILKSLISE